MADPSLRAFVNIRTLEPISSEAWSATALTPTLRVGTLGVGMAASVVILALVNVLAPDAVPKVSVAAGTAVAA